MSIVHVAFYPSDWLAGTRGLTASETGVYITLVARMYEMAGPIERNDDRLARLCGCTRAAFARDLESLMTEGKIFETEDGLFNERARKEIEKTTEISAKARAAAESRWKKKPKKNNVAKNANASSGHMPERCQPEPEPDTQETNVSCVRARKRASRLREDWVLPSSWGQWALSEGWPEPTIRAEAEKFRDHWISKSGRDATKRDWEATWRNWMRRTPKHSPKGRDNGRTGADIAAEAAAIYRARLDSRTDCYSSQPLLPAGDAAGREPAGPSGLDWDAGGSFDGGHQSRLRIVSS